MLRVIVYDWKVHINEDFVAQVKAPNIEAALTIAFAKLRESSRFFSELVFDIQVVNLTIYSKA